MTLGLALLLILVYPLPLVQRLGIVVLLLLHFAVFLYAFTWMVEIYQVLFAVAASLLLVDAAPQRSRHARASARCSRSTWPCCWCSRRSASRTRCGRSACCRSRASRGELLRWTRSPRW